MPEYPDIQKPKIVEKHKTGAVRSSQEGKGRYDLISVHGMRRLAVHYERGIHYGSRNWEGGLSMSRYLNSAIRHLFRYLGGDRSEDHLAAAAWNIFALMDHEERIERKKLPEELNDLPKPGDMFRPDEFVEGK